MIGLKYGHEVFELIKNYIKFGYQVFNHLSMLLDVIQDGYYLNIYELLLWVIYICMMVYTTSTTTNISPHILYEINKYYQNIIVVWQVINLCIPAQSGTIYNEQILFQNIKLYQDYVLYMVKSVDTFILYNIFYIYLFIIVLLVQDVLFMLGI